MLNARNGGPVPHFKITETPTYDPSGQGHRAEQPVQDAAVPERRLVLHGRRRLLAGRPGEVQLPRQPADRRVRNGSGQPDRQSDPGRRTWRTTCRSSARRRSAAYSSGQYLVYGGAGGGGIFGYPPSAYSPQTHTYYACLMNESGAHTNQGEHAERLDHRRPGDERDPGLHERDRPDEQHDEMAVRRAGQTAWAPATAARSRPPATWCSPGSRAGSTRPTCRTRAPRSRARRRS